MNYPMMNASSPLTRLACTLALGLAGSGLFADAGSLELFYESPAEFAANATSNEALPVGNGKLAAMVYGGVRTEIVQFNEDTVWAGRPNDYSHPGAVDWLEQIREYVWAGQGEAAWNNAVKDHFMSVPIRQSPYQPAGEWRLEFPHTGTVTGYRRSLDLETATAAVEYAHNGTGYRREVFASYPDQVVVLRLTTDTPGSLSFNGSYNTPHTRSSVVVEGPDLVLNAQVNDDPNTRRQPVSEIEFQARTRVRVEGGSVEVSGSRFVVSDADAVTLILSVATNFVRFDDISADPEARTLAVIEAADQKGYAAMRADQLADYTELFGRVSIELGDSPAAALPMNERLDALNSAFRDFKSAHGWGDPATFAGSFTGHDPSLVALNFQMARYLMIAGSRPGSQPLTLQGKWNNELDPSWESKMTLNINQEMNYWLAEVANLPECHLPMVEMVRDLAESGAVVAAGHYGAGGWMVHHNTDLWRAAAPINNPGGIWPTGNAWLAMHLWWHYEYNRDPAYLEDIYPLLKGAAEFHADFLVEDPREGNPPYLLTNPTHSPEHPNPVLGDDGEIVAGTTMDSQLIRALFGYVIEAGSRLGVDAEFRELLADKQDRLPPNQIGRHGQLQEWLEDVDEPENPAIGGHRHLSHLVDLFPGEGIHPLHEPELAAASQVVLDWKGDPSNNTAWSRAWKMTLRNALLQGDHGLMILTDVLANSHTDNLTFSNKGNENQIDGNLGVAMGTAQFFLQSRRGEIHLLPALPQALAQGRVSGLRAKGGFTVDLEWAEGQLTAASLHSALGETAVLRSSIPLTATRLSDGTPVPVSSPGSQLYRLETSAGETILLAPAPSASAWSVWPRDAAGNVDTGDFLGWINVRQAPWVWSFSLDGWLFLPEGAVHQAGAWAYVLAQ